MGVASAAAGLAGLTIIFSSCAWMLYGGEPSVGRTRAIAPAPQRLGSESAGLQGDLPPAPRVRFANLETTFASRFAPAATDDSSDAPATTGALSSFDERFSFARSGPPSRSLQPSLSFADRFGPANPSGDVAGGIMVAAPAMTAALAIPTAPAPHVAAAAPAPHAATRSIAQAAQAAPKRPAAAPYRLASLSDTPLPTAYAPADAATKDTGITDLLRKLSLRGSTSNDPAANDAAPQNAAPEDANPFAPDANHTAVYDISAHVVYLPSGKRLEAHSGLGEYMDDVRSVKLKDLGVTPPNVYELKLREASFHGVEAIRLNPVGGDEMYGRVGILAHPFMLGPNGQSNGCVSVKDYQAFLNAYKRGEITHLVVVERLDNTRTAADWLSNTLKGIFGRS